MFSILVVLACGTAPVAEASSQLGSDELFITLSSDNASSSRLSSDAIQSLQEQILACLQAQTFGPKPATEEFLEDLRPLETTHTEAEPKREALKEAAAKQEKSCDSIVAQINALKNDYKELGTVAEEQTEEQSRDTRDKIRLIRWTLVGLLYKAKHAGSGEHEDHHEDVHPPQPTPTRPDTVDPNRIPCPRRQGEFIHDKGPPLEAHITALLNCGSVNIKTREDAINHICDWQTGFEGGVPTPDKLVGVRYPPHDVQYTWQWAKGSDSGGTIRVDPGTGLQIDGRPVTTVDSSRTPSSYS